MSMQLKHVCSRPQESRIDVHYVLSVWSTDCFHNDYRHILYTVRAFFCGLVPADLPEIRQGNLIFTGAINHFSNTVKTVYNDHFIRGFSVF